MDWTYLLQLVWYFLPVYVANGSPPLLAKLPLLGTWNAPVDLGRDWGKRRLFGDHKTWRGLIGGILLAGIVFLVQQRYVSIAPLVPYAMLPWWLGFLLGAGALLGDLVKSFFKRRITIKPGGNWAPFDQIDYAVGAFLLSFPVFWPGLPAALYLVVLSGAISAAAHYLGFQLKVNKERF